MHLSNRCCVSSIISRINRDTNTNTNRIPRNNMAEYRGIWLNTAEYGGIRWNTAEYGGYIAHKQATVW